MTLTFPQLKTFTTFILERHRIHQVRRVGAPAPWTKDPILSQYRFTNVYRELDRVTIWLRKHWRTPHKRHPDLWFAMLVGRLVNWPDSLEHLALPGRWNPKQFTQAMHARKGAGHKVFTSAYIIPTGATSGDKIAYLRDKVFTPAWEQRDTLRPHADDTLLAFHNRLIALDGLGHFLSAQVVADMKYVEPLKSASDWWTFAASGPGSRRGMAYVLGWQPDIAWKEHEWREALTYLSVAVAPVIKRAGMPRLHNQDLQNCLCEFSKYMRTKLGTGKPKQGFDAKHAGRLPAL